MDAWDRIFGATPAVNFSRKGAWDTCSAAYAAAFGHRGLQQNAPCSLIKLPGNHSSSHAVFYKLPCDFGKLPCGFTEPHTDFGKLPRNLVKLPCLMSRSCAVLPSPHATLASSRAVLPASVRHRLIDLAPAAVKFLLRPCHDVFAILCAHRTKPPLVKAIGFSPLGRHFDDALSPL